MGRIGSPFKNKGRIKCVSITFTFGFWFRLILLLLASISSLGVLPEESKSTMRSWPSHEFLQDLISAANSTKIHHGDSNFHSEKSIFGENFKGLPINGTNGEENSSIVPQNRMDSSRDSNETLQDVKVPDSSFIETRIPLVVIDSRRDRFGTNPSNLNASQWFEKSPAPVDAVQVSFENLDDINSIPSTAPSIPLFTGATDQLETTLESPPVKIQFHHETRRLPLNRRPYVQWGIGPVRFTTAASTNTANYYSTQNTWTTHVPVDTSTPPIIRPTVVSTTVASIPPRPSALPPIGESVKETSTAREMPEVHFKVWSYGDHGLQLETQREIPRKLLSGINITNGQVVNIDHIPLPIRKAIASAFNLNSSLIKRASGPGSMDAYHWQQLPSVMTPMITTTVPPPPRRWTQLQNSPNQMAINYVIWTTTPPPLPPPVSSSNPVMEIFHHLLHQSPVRTPHQIFNPPPLMNSYNPEEVTIVPQSAHENKLKEADILANVASMALIMSKINKNLGQFQESVHANDNMSPQALLPLYMQFLKSGQSALGSEFTLKKSSPTPLLHRDTEHALHSDYDYGFYPTNRPRIPAAHAQAASEYDDSHKNRFLFNEIKKKLKRFRKKKKKRRRNKKNSGINSLFNPGKFKFNYAFGIDILGTLQKMFYTMLALNAAPIILLTILALAPLVLIAIPKFIKGVSLAKILWHYFHPPRPKNYHNHYPTQIKYIHRHPPRHHYYHHFQLPSHHHKGWPQNTQPWRPGPPRGWSHHRSEDVAETGDPTWVDNATQNIGSLVQLSYGDPFKHRADDDEGQELLDDGGKATTPFALYETELDTEHNRKVMEILMNSKNSTLMKLLESWELNSPSVSATLETGPDSEPNGKEVVAWRRKKRSQRHVRSPKLGRVVQIPESTNVA